jgi:methionine aminopeptidase
LFWDSIAQTIVHQHQFYKKVAFPIIIMDQALVTKYKAAQSVAKRTITYLESIIREGITEADIASAADKFMTRKGATSFWYHGIGSLVFVGPRTRLSLSGKDYIPSQEPVRSTDLVTVDLSPAIDGYWGDHARTLIISDGSSVRTARQDYSYTVNKMFEESLRGVALHRELRLIATPDMTYGSLHEAMDEVITLWGYQNLDFKGNLGHSIENNLDDREYIAPGSLTKLGDKPFTFEPHIGLKDSAWGYKREDIYYFSDGKLHVL